MTPEQNERPRVISPEGIPDDETRMGDLRSALTDHVRIIEAFGSNKVEADPRVQAVADMIGEAFDWDDQTVAALAGRLTDASAGMTPELKQSLEFDVYIQSKLVFERESEAAFLIEGFSRSDINDPESWPKDIVSLQKELEMVFPREGGYPEQYVTQRLLTLLEMIGRQQWL